MKFYLGSYNSQVEGEFLTKKIRNQLDQKLYQLDQKLYQLDQPQYQILAVKAHYLNIITSQLCTVFLEKFVTSPIWSQLVKLSVSNRLYFSMQFLRGSNFELLVHS